MTASALVVNAPMLMAEACKTYCWTLDYVLNMPAISFFAMLKAARKVHAIKMLELCDVHAIPSCTSKYYETIKQRYLDVLTEDQPTQFEEIETQRPVMDSRDETTRAAIFDIFAAKKGTL